MQLARAKAEAKLNLKATLQQVLFCFRKSAKYSFAFVQSLPKQS
jgi:hypothetical protein